MAFAEHLAAGIDQRLSLARRIRRMSVQRLDGFEMENAMDGMRMSSRMIASVWIAGFALLGWGCSDDEVEEVEPDVATSPSDMWLEQVEAGEYSGHLVEDAIRDCHVLDALDLFLIRQFEARGGLTEEEWPTSLLEEMASVMEIDLSSAEDEFEESRLLDEVEERVGERARVLDESSLCVEFELYVDEYDFDEEAVKLPELGMHEVFRVPQKAWNRAPRGLPEDYELPFLAVFVGGGLHLPMDSEEAEDLLATLPRVEKVEDEKVDDDQEAYFTKPPLEIWPSEALQALDGSERVALLYRDGSGGEVVSELEAKLEPEPGLRKVEAMAVVSRLGGEGDVHHPVEVDADTVELPAVLLIADHVMVRTPEADEVAYVWPSSEHRTSEDVVIEEPDFTRHRQLFDEICEGDAEQKSQTRMQEGELREVVTKGCSSCPSFTAAAENWRRRDEEMDFEKVVSGSFSRPGAIETLVHSRRCGLPYHGGETRNGGVSILRNLVSGVAVMVDYTDSGYLECKYLETGQGTTLPVCRGYGTGDSLLDISWRALQTGGGELDEKLLFREVDSLDICHKPDSRSIEPESIEIVKGDNGDSHLRIELVVTRLLSVDESADCRDRSALDTETEQVELLFDVTASGLAATDATKRKMTELEFVENMVGR